MPQFMIEAPVGIGDDAKRKLMRDITSALDEAYQMPDVRIWLREYPAGNVAQDGNIGAEPVRPLCFLEAPELLDLGIKSKMAAKIHSAVEEAYHGLANTAETLVLMNHYPLENAGWAGRLQSENPEAVAHIRQINS